MKPVFTSWPIAQGGGLVPRGTRVEVFQEIYWVFLLLGTLVGVVVVGYMLYTAYAYRADGGRGAGADVDRPTLGELPTGSGGGRKLALSLTASAVIVIVLIAWTFGTLLYVEADPPDEGPGGGDQFNVTVTGYQFGWAFEYPNGNTSNGELRVPEGTTVRLRATSSDVFHNFGVPALRVKTDAIPNQWTDTWFVAEETGTYQAQCYELCGAGHSGMTAEVIVMEPAAFERWYANTTGEENATTTTASASGGE